MVNKIIQKKVKKKKETTKKKKKIVAGSHKDPWARLIKTAVMCGRESQRNKQILAH